MAERQLHEVGPVGTGTRRPVTRAGRGTAVRRPAGRPAEELPHQPVVRLQDRGDPLRVLRLAPRQPAQLRHGLRGLGHRPDRLGPGLPPAEPVDQIRRGGLGTPVVAEHRRPYEIALVVQRHQPVLLRGHTDGLYAFEQPSGGRLTE